MYIRYEEIPIKMYNIDHTIGNKADGGDNAGKLTFSYKFIEPMVIIAAIIPVPKLINMLDKSGFNFIIKIPPLYDMLEINNIL